MCNYTYIYCSGCGKKLWSDDLQLEDEYECQAEIQRKVQGGALWVTLKNGKEKRLKTEMCQCDRHLCVKCARTRRFKCTRPQCKGPLRLVKKERH